MLQREGRKNPILIAVWAKDLSGVYNAETVAATLGDSDAGSDARRKLRNHRDEYLVEGGIAADEYRILAKFEGSGPDRGIVLECPFYEISVSIPSGFFPGKRSDNPLRDIEEEIYSRSGAQNDRKRDEFVKAISGSSNASLSTFPALRYE